MKRFFLGVAVTSALALIAATGVETLYINSQTRGVLNPGVVNFATGKLQVNGSAVTAGGGTVTSVGISSNATWLAASGSAVTTSGTLTLNLATGLTGNLVLATPNGSTGSVGLRALVANDIPALNSLNGTLNWSKVAVPSISSTIFVSQASGDDANSGGILNGAKKTLANAKSAAASGATIAVLDGTFNENNLLKNGVGWFFFPGTKIANTASVAVFGDGTDGTNAAVTCEIDGFGSFSTSGGRPVVYLEKDGTNVTIYANAINSTATTGDSMPIWQLGNSTLTVYADSLNAAAAYCVYWQNGQADLYIKRLSIDGTAGGFAAIDSSQQSPVYGQLYVHSDLIECSTESLPAIRMSTAQATSRTWIDALQISAWKTIAMNGSGLLYVTTQKLLGEIGVSGSTGKLYVNAQKIAPFNSNFYADALFTSGSNATTELNIGEWDAANLTGGNAILTFSGTHRIINPKIISPASTINDAAISVSGGTVNIFHPLIDTSADALTDAVKVTAGTANVIDPFITTNAAKKDFNRTGGTLNVTNGRGSNSDGSFTTSGTVNYLSNNVTQNDSRLTNDRTANALRTATAKSISTSADPSNGQILTFNSTSGKWEPQTPAGGGNVTGSSLTGGNVITGNGGSTIQDSGVALTNLQSGYQSATVSAAGNTASNIAQQSHTLYLTANAGAGTYTATVSIPTAGRAAGDRESAHLHFAATANPTVEIHNATSGGTLLFTWTGDGTVTDILTEYRFDGAAWYVHDAHFVW